ncbi:acyltransferase-domain-containing protein [Naematelia encephala]|uniref:Tafazzin family protein n=1 Tax=Naematelia encephala TaxID=71784 RepID=A0A1Y2AKI4_9TREE|nr:acyltransferase-domain-containing protein [Naematelia encephala]
MAPTLASALTLSATAYTTKISTKLLCRSIKVEGLPILLDALRERPLSSISSLKGKEKEISLGVEGGASVEESGGLGRRGIVTVCNHNSVIDDPTMWSMLPVSNYFPFASPSHTSRNTRWTLGASDIMFTKPWHRQFFTNGQVIETFRGKGIFQPAVDHAVKLLQDGEWIHIFPEGRVNQENVNPQGGLLRFKWGIGRIIMDSKIMPEIIPIWISGYDQMMNENRGFPRPFPRPGAKISMTVGESLTDRIQPLVDQWREMASKEPGAVGVGGDWAETGTEQGDGGRLKDIRSKGDMAQGGEKDVRIKICEVLQEGVRQLGERVERAEGRFDRGDWSQSTRRVSST